MKMNKAAHVLSAVALSGLISVTPAYAEEMDTDYQYSSLNESFDDYFEEAAYAGGEEHLSDAQIQQLILRAL